MTLLSRTLALETPTKSTFFQEELKLRRENFEEIINEIQELFTLQHCSKTSRDLISHEIKFRLCHIRNLI